MVDPGPEPTVADCTKVFPLHEIAESESQMQSACGALAPNMGKVEATHREDGGGTFSFTFQHATVPCPIASVADPAVKICEWLPEHCLHLHKGAGALYFMEAWLELSPAHRRAGARCVA